MQKINKQFLKQISEQYGETAPSIWLQHHYSKPENVTEFINLFPNHITDTAPPFHFEMMHEMASGGRVAFASPRGFAKSTITDVVMTGWFALNTKYHFILIISDTYTQAKMQLSALKSELENNQSINDIYGDVRGRVWGEDTIIINGLQGEVMVMALGAGMKIRGLKFNQYRPELAIIDDLENQEAVSNKERRDKLERWFLFDMMPGLAKDGNIIYIGTIMHFNSLLMKIVSKEQRYISFRTHKYQAITNGQSLWPSRWPIEKLVAMRDDPNDPDYLGALVFAQEMQNDPQDDHERIFKTDWLNNRYKLFELRREWELKNENSSVSFEKSFFERIIGGVDPAISEKQTADYFAFTTIGIAHGTGHIYTLDYFKARIGDPMQQVQTILDKYEEWGHDNIKVETVAYQKGLYTLVRNEGAKRGIYAPLSEFKPDADKVRRARIHSANFSGGIVHLRDDHPLFEDFINELLQFPLGEHDDMLDSFMNASDETVTRRRSRMFSAKPSVFR
jgi:predicted phage terminase large subunit-like protein